MAQPSNIDRYSDGDKEQIGEDQDRLIPIDSKKRERQKRSVFTKSTDDSPADKLAAEVSRYLHLPSSGNNAFMALMGAVAANLVDGWPCWLVFVGSSGCGKSLLLDLIMGLNNIYDASSPKGEQAFLSATPRKDRSRDSTGGLLRQVKLHGALVMNDITSILCKQEKDAREILSIYRECHGGYWTRPTGSDGGMPLRWDGKLAVFGGCTNEIDNFHHIIQVMGERWLYYRLNSTEMGMLAKARSALDNGGRGSEWKKHLKTLIRDFFEGLDLRFCPQTGKLPPRRRLTTLEQERIIRMSQVIVKCRSAPSREKYTHDITAPPSQEEPTRIATSLGQLRIGLELIGLDAPRAWSIIGRTAMDSMPKARSVVLELIKDKGNIEGVTLGEIMKATRMSSAPIDRMLTDMEIFGVLEHYTSIVGVMNPNNKGEAKTRYRLTPWMKREWEEGWGITI